MTIVLISFEIMIIYCIDRSKIWFFTALHVHACDLVTKYSIAVRSRYNLCHFAYTVQVLAPWKNNCVKDVCPVC